MDRQSLSRLLDLPHLPDYLGEIDDNMRELAGKTEFEDTLSALFKSGGKRLRPAILIATATACDHKIDQSVISAALAVELIHQASLAHDQITDEASQTTVAQLLLAGDFLLAAGLDAAASSGTKAVKILAQTVKTMALGQASQLQSHGPANPADPFYIETIKNKTASLFSAAARIGAAGSRVDDSLSNYGRDFGISFQIVDDIIDGDIAAKSTNLAVFEAKRYSAKAAAHLRKLDAKKTGGLAKLPVYYLSFTLAD